MSNIKWRRLLEWGTPSAAIRALRRENQLPDELAALVGVQQSAEHHPEGDAFEHTCHVVDAMAEIVSREGLTGERRAMFMFAALTHDFGKATTTVWNEKKAKWTAYGHDVAGVQPASTFLAGAGETEEMISRVAILVRYHMAHTRQGFSVGSVHKLASSLKPLTIADLLLVLEADCAGRPPIPPGLPAVVTQQLIPTAVVNGWMDAPPAPFVVGFA